MLCFKSQSFYWKLIVSFWTIFGGNYVQNHRIGNLAETTFFSKCNFNLGRPKRTLSELDIKFSHLEISILNRLNSRQNMTNFDFDNFRIFHPLFSTRVSNIGLIHDADVQKCIFDAILPNHNFETKKIKSP